MHQNNKQATSTRKHCCSQRPQTRASFSTEYQERFLPPHCHTAIVSTSTHRDPYHPLKGTSAEMTTLRSICVTQKWAKPPPKAPQPSGSPKYHRRCSSATQNPTQNPRQNTTLNPMRFGADLMAPKVANYTSVYKNDFQPWKVKQRLPFKLSDCLTVNQGLVVTNHPSESRFQKNSIQVPDNSKAVPEVRKPQPFESVTCYRSDYVPHPVQPTFRVKPVHHTTSLISETAASVKPKVAWEVNRDMCDEAGAFFQEFKNWSLENKFHGKGKAKEPGPPADDCDTEHKCQCAKPVLPSKQSREKTKEYFCGPATMEEDSRSWDRPQRFPSVRKDLDWPKKTPPRGFSQRRKSDEKASSCNATKSTRCPGENGALSNLECNCPRTEESRMYWTRSLDRGVTWADGGMFEEHPQAHQMISYMVSSRS